MPTRPSTSSKPLLASTSQPPAIPAVRVKSNVTVLPRSAGTAAPRERAAAIGKPTINAISLIRVPLRATIHVLAQRINRLARYTRDQGLVAPGMEEGEYLMIRSVFETIELEMEDTSGPTSSRRGDDDKNTCLGRESSDRDDEALDSDAVSGLQTPLTAAAAPPQNAAEEDEEDEDEVTTQVSCRLGKLQVTHDGLLRYFWSTSNLTLLDILVGVAPSCQVSSQRATQGGAREPMAMRLAFDLGLHLGMAPYVARGIILHENYEICRMTFWAVYLSEQFWDYYLGRPTRSLMDGVTVPKPD
ncbi:hypothetical protein BDW74DRAFT_176735 [Aspergillus multicolor]|uniref:fungal specific transcription factor domain-containing protein n=1 Tax=Aspergillus multicolor TaxID=41759 RepID=UPI003CCD1122